MAIGVQHLPVDRTGGNEGHGHFKIAFPFGNFQTIGPAHAPGEASRIAVDKTVRRRAIIDCVLDDTLA